MINVAKNLAARTALTAQTGSLVSPTRKVMSVNWKQDYVDALYIETFLHWDFLFALPFSFPRKLPVANQSWWSMRFLRENFWSALWRTFWYWQGGALTPLPPHLMISDNKLNLRDRCQEAHILSKACLVLERGGVVEVIDVSHSLPSHREQ